MSCGEKTIPQCTAISLLKRWTFSKYYKRINEYKYSSVWLMDELSVIFVSFRCCWRCFWKNSILSWRWRPCRPDIRWHHHHLSSLSRMILSFDFSNTWLCSAGSHMNVFVLMCFSLVRWDERDASLPSSVFYLFLSSERSVCFIMWITEELGELFTYYCDHYEGF